MISYYLYPLYAYLIGSIPFGLIFSNIFGNGNLRESGSKNIGATNVLRTQGKFLGGMTFLFDFAKGFFACYLLQTDSDLINLLIIAAPVVGHIFPIWLKFKGGKGVATYFGVICALNIYVFLGTILIWSIIFIITKVSSIAGLSSVIASCVIFFFIKYKNHLDFINQLYVLIIIVMVIIVKHHDNIRRLIKKKELKI